MYLACRLTIRMYMEDLATTGLERTDESYRTPSRLARPSLHGNIRRRPCESPICQLPPLSAGRNLERPSRSDDVHRTNWLRRLCAGLALAKTGNGLLHGTVISGLYITPNLTKKKCRVILTLSLPSGGRWCPGANHEGSVASKRALGGAHSF